VTRKLPPLWGGSWEALVPKQPGPFRESLGAF
jgi:hypothetical protein